MTYRRLATLIGLVAAIVGTTALPAHAGHAAGQGYDPLTIKVKASGQWVDATGSGYAWSLLKAGKGSLGQPYATFGHPTNNQSIPTDAASFPLKFETHPFQWPAAVDIEVVWKKRDTYADNAQISVPYCEQFNPKPKVELKVGGTIVQSGQPSFSQSQKELAHTFQGVAPDGQYILKLTCGHSPAQTGLYYRDAIGLANLEFNEWSQPGAYLRWERIESKLANPFIELTDGPPGTNGWWTAGPTHQVPLSYFPGPGQYRVLARVPGAESFTTAPGRHFWIGPPYTLDIQKATDAAKALIGTAQGQRAQTGQELDRLADRLRALHARGGGGGCAECATLLGEAAALKHQLEAAGGTAEPDEALLRSVQRLERDVDRAEASLLRGGAGPTPVVGLPTPAPAPQLAPSPRPGSTQVGPQAAVRPGGGAPDPAAMNLTRELAQLLRRLRAMGADGEPLVRRVLQLQQAVERTGQALPPDQLRDLVRQTDQVKREADQLQLRAAPGAGPATTVAPAPATAPTPALTPRPAPRAVRPSQ